jgi:hypothetical protein
MLFQESTKFSRRYLGMKACGNPEQVKWIIGWVV